MSLTKFGNILSAMGNVFANTVLITISDVSSELKGLIETQLGSTVQWSTVRAAIITCESNDCRIAFGVAASGTVGHVLAADQSIRIPSNSLVQAARVINKTAGSNAVIQVTLEG